MAPESTEDMGMDIDKLLGNAACDDNAIDTDGGKTTEDVGGWTTDDGCTTVVCIGADCG